MISQKFEGGVVKEKEWKEKSCHLCFSTDTNDSTRVNGLFLRSSWPRWMRMYVNLFNTKCKTVVPKRLSHKPRDNIQYVSVRDISNRSSCCHPLDLRLENCQNLYK